MFDHFSTSCKKGLKSMFPIIQKKNQLIGFHRIRNKGLNWVILHSQFTRSCQKEEFWKFLILFSSQLARPL